MSNKRQLNEEDDFGTNRIVFDSCILQNHLKSKNAIIFDNKKLSKNYLKRKKAIILINKKGSKNYVRRKSAITLIALIVTIIVLLILAGVTISMVTGNNGVLTKATNAAEKTNI